MNYRASTPIERFVDRANQLPVTGTAPDGRDPYRNADDDEERGTIPYVVVIGAASFDLKGRVLGDRVFEGSSNTGMLTAGIGGVGRNVAENLARLDIATTLIAAVADDLLGALVVQATAQAGVNTECVLTVPGGRTGTYLGLLTPDGNLLMGIDDMRIMRCITPRVIEESRSLLRHAGMVILDANVPLRTIRATRRICSAAGVPVCIEPVSLPLMDRIVPYLSGTALFTPNVAEAETVLKRGIASVDDALTAALELREWDIDIVVVTLGGGGAVYATSEGSGHVPAIQTDVVDESGAGTAMTAGIVCGLMHRFAIDEAVALGASAASLTLLSPETVRSDISLEQVYEHLVV